MKFSNIIFLFKKELRGVSRDRRTLIMLILLPLLFYPLLIKSLDHFQQSEAQKLDNFKPTIVISGQKNDSVLIGGMFEKKGNFRIVSLGVEVAEKQLREGKIQGIVEISNTGSESGKSSRLTYKYKSADAKSRRSYESINNLFNQFKMSAIEEKIGHYGISESILGSSSLSGIDVSSKEELASMAFTIIPYFMIISILAGAISVGIDLTAGEKERGTMATLLSSQLSKGEIAVGKVTFTAFAGCVSSVLSVIGLIIALRTNENDSLAITMLSAKAMLIMLAILLPAAIFIGSLIISLGLYARSIKEANSYTTPLYLLVIFLGVLTTVEGFSLSSNLYYVPILNTIFALKSVLSFKLDNQLIVAAISSAILYSVISILISIKLYKRENVLFRT